MCVPLPYIQCSSKIQCGSKIQGSSLFLWKLTLSYMWYINTAPRDFCIWDVRVTIFELLKGKIVPFLWENFLETQIKKDKVWTLLTPSNVQQNFLFVAIQIATLCTHIVLLYVFYHKPFLVKSELTERKSDATKHTGSLLKYLFKVFSLVKENWNTFLRIFMAYW